MKGGIDVHVVVSTRPDGGAAMGGIAAHGYVNGKAGAARQG